MTILLPDGSEHPPAVPALDQWAEEDRVALYELAQNIAAIKRFSKLIGKLVMWATALAVLIYYVMNAKHLVWPVAASLKG